MKIATIIGARPQFIKACKVSREIASFAALKEVIIHTGQHFDPNMSSVFFSELDLRPPDYILDIHCQTHATMTGHMMIEIEKILFEERPNAVMVYGDTNSTLAGALAAVKLKIPIVHIEAGLRSFNMTMPEEVNRIVTDRISSWLFTPTYQATKNLLREGFSKDKVLQVGDVMYDMALFYGNKATEDINLLKKLGIKPRKYLLATVHRAENVDDKQRLSAIIEALDATTKILPVVWPLHPRTRTAFEKNLRLNLSQLNILFIDPIGYFDMVQLEKNAALIATDSGGVQKEAFFHQVPCVTMRGETEWGELVEAGWNRLALPTDSYTLQQAFLQALGSCGKSIKPYGEGDASKRIAMYLIEKLLYEYHLS